jgi:hypothetical protein
MTVTVNFTLLVSVPRHHHQPPPLTTHSHPPLSLQLNRHTTNMGGTSVRDVDPHVFVKAYAQFLKRSGTLTYIPLNLNLNAMYI